MPSEQSAAAEPDAAATLRDLNAEYIRAFVESDTAWYREHLRKDFLCTLSDGRQIDKTEFLSLNAGSPGVTDVAFDEIDIRVLGDVALVHAVTHYRRDDVPGSRRYTDVWVLEDDHWLAVAAQVTPVA
jgi:ketosteroid isomerase-like protein